MKAAIQTSQNIYSEYGSDPEMTDLVELFVADIPHKIASFKAYTATSDWRSLGTMAHQLKGAAGGYGFHDLTEPALQVERAVREAGTEEQILESVQVLIEICQRVRVGSAR